MMATTTPDEIYSPDRATPGMTVAWSKVIADSVQAALVGMRKEFAQPVANAAGRNALFPSPKQSNRVFRSDLGYDEMYYAAFDPVSNASGATPPGWYPATPGSAFMTLLPSAPQTLYPNDSYTAWAPVKTGHSMQRGDLFTATSGSITVTRSGRYRLSASLLAGSGSGTVTNALIRNGDRTYTAALGQGTQDLYPTVNAACAIDIPALKLAAGDTISWNVVASVSVTYGVGANSSNIGSGYFHIEFLSPG